MYTDVDDVSMKHLNKKRDTWAISVLVLVCLFHLNGLQCHCIAQFYYNTNLTYCIVSC